MFTPYLLHAHPLHALIRTQQQELCCNQQQNVAVLSGDHPSLCSLHYEDIILTISSLNHSHQLWKPLITDIHSQQVHLEDLFIIKKIK